MAATHPECTQLEPSKHRPVPGFHSAYRPIHEATTAGYGVSGTAGRSSDSWASAPANSPELVLMAVASQAPRGAQCE